MNIETLVERVEAAVGADRELDRDVMLAAVPCDRGPFRYWAPMNENTGHGAVDVERVYYAPHCAQAVEVPKFTASLDAAMTLVPEGWSLDLRTFETAPGAGAVLHRGLEPSHHSTAATPALALTAAALKARAQCGE